jgi:hypothetical protein
VVLFFLFPFQVYILYINHVNIIDSTNLSENPGNNEVPPDKTIEPNILFRISMDNAYKDSKYVTISFFFFFLKNNLNRLPYTSC